MEHQPVGDQVAVGHSEEAGLSRMTFVVDAGTTDVEQVVKQLDKLIDRLAPAR